MFIKKFILTLTWGICMRLKTDSHIAENLVKDWRETTKWTIVFAGDVSVDILFNGEVEVEGRVNAGVVTSTSAPISFNRRARRVTPPGHFTINFTLPGPCDTNFAKAKLNSDGVIEGVVLKDGIFKAH